MTLSEYLNKRIAGHEAAKDTIEMFELTSRDPAYLEAFFASLDGLRPSAPTVPERPQRPLTELGNKTIKISTFGGTTYDKLALSLLSAYVIRCNDEARDITEYLNHPGLKEWRMPHWEQ